MSTWGTVYELERDKATGNDPESLRREIERLRAALDQIRDCTSITHARALAKRAVQQAKP